MSFARIGKSIPSPSGYKSNDSDTLTLDNPVGWGVSEPWAGINVGEDTQLQLSTSFQAIRLISETIATLPLSVFRKKDSFGAVDKTHKLHKLLGFKPNNFMDSVQFIESIAVGLVCQGHSYSFKQVLGNDQVFSITPLLKSRVIPRVEGNAIRYRVTDEKGKTEDYGQKEILSIRGFGGVNALEGFAPHKLHRQTLATTMAAESFVGNYFGKGGHMGGFIETDTKLKKENLDAWHKNFSARHSSPEDVHRYILLSAGMKAVPRSDGSLAELSATRGDQVAEIARVYNVPTFLLMDMSRATWGNSESQFLQFYKQTLTPYLVRIEKALNTQLFPESEWGEYYCKFNVEGLLRGDSESRAKFYQAMRGASLMTIDEGRGKENMRPIGAENGGDDVHVPLNMAPASQLSDIQKPNTPKGEE